MKFYLNKMIRPHLLQSTSYNSSRNPLTDQSSIYLDANENPYGEHNRYPDANHVALKERLAEVIDVETEQLFLGNGSDELIDLAMRIFCEPREDSIMVMDPSFVMYHIYAKMNNLQTEKLPLNEDFQLEKEVFQQVVSACRAKTLFLCSPNNPTGNSLNDIEFYIKSFNGIVVVDEAYIEFSKKPGVISLLEKYANLIVLRTLSKAYGMAGLRIGIGIASPAIAALFNKYKPPFNISSSGQQLALEHLGNMAVLKDRIKLIVEARDKLRSELIKNEHVVKVFPSDANFLLVKFHDAGQVYRKLKEANILISLRHPDLPNCLRITIGTEEENVKLIETLSKICK